MERLPYYHILHVFALLVLTAQTFLAFGNPDPAGRKRTMMITGIATLLIFISGFGMLHILSVPFSTGWVLVKFVAWLGLSALAGIAYRRPELRGTLSFIALVLLLVALVMVYLKPF